jgi:hypothetical protein
MIFIFRFHVFNGGRQSESVQPGCHLQEDELFARPLPDLRAPKGWLADLINKYVFYLKVETIYLSAMLAGSANLEASKRCWKDFRLDKDLQCL